VIDQKVIVGANHFFDDRIEPLMQSIGTYLDKRLKIEPPRRPLASGARHLIEGIAKPSIS